MFHLAKQSDSARKAAYAADEETLRCAEELQNSKLSTAAAIATSTPLHVTCNASLKLINQTSWQSQRIAALREEVRQSCKEIGRAIEALGMVMQHDFPASHHYCGPHDNAGKVPRDGMRRDEAFEKERIYNYHKCFEW